MKIEKQILIVGSVIVVIISVFFFNIGAKYSKEYKITAKEMDGIVKITNIHKLDLLIKNIRGVSQLKNLDAKSLLKSLFISQDKILEIVQQLNDKRIEVKYLNIIKEKKNYSNEELFLAYTDLLKLLAHKRVDVADNSHLLFESNREVYFLATTVIFNIPKSIENIGKIRGIGAALLRNHQDNAEDVFLLKSNVYMFLENIEDIIHIIEKLASKDSTRLKILLDSIVTDFYETNKLIDKILDNTLIIPPKEYFLKITKLLNHANNLFNTSKKLLKDKLQERESNLTLKLFFGTLFYILLLGVIIVTIYINYKIKDKENRLAKKKELEDNFIATLQESYLINNDLKAICNKSLTHIADYFKAINASLYLYDKENEKLYLGATYGIGYDTISHTLTLHENIISETTLHKKTNIMNIQKEIDLGTIKITANKLITMPLIEFEKSIGTVQLLFNDNVDIKFLEEVISLMATYISKALQDDESSRYLDLINKNVLISQTDLDGNITQVSNALCTLSKFSREELINQNHRILKHDDMVEEIYDELWSTITSGVTWRGEIKNRAKDGEFYWTDSIIYPDYDINKNIIGYTAIRTNITDKKKIQEIAIRDGLTSLFNRRYFDEIFSKQIKINKRAKNTLVFALVDIDHFKQYNDIYGHQDGDKTLKLVANALRDTLKRADDYTFRLGGEEFGLLYNINHENDGVVIANLAKKSVENLKIEHSGNSACKYVTISIGVYIIKPTDLHSKDDIYRKSDESLYLAKKSGRNQVKVYKSNNLT